MKRFKYSLDTVLEYKTQVLDNLRAEHAVITRSVNQKKEELNHLHGELSSYQTGFDETKASGGATIENFWLYSMCIDRMEQIIEEEKQKLAVLEEKQEKKKNEVVGAKVDTSKFEKLKEKRFREYQRAEQKEEENFVEETAVRMLMTNRKQK